MIAIIINPVSGGATRAIALRRADEAMHHLARLGATGEVYLTERRGHAHTLAALAIQRGASRVIAWGGDGTVNEVASAVIGHDVMLGIVPSGSGNGLARELRLPTRVPAAIERAVLSAGRAIDAGTIDGQWFFSIAGVGLDAQVAAAFDRDGGRRGLIGYVRMTGRELLRYACESYVIDDGVPRTALLVTFANTTQFGNGARIAPHAKLDDGLLDVVTFEERSRLRTIWGLPRLFTGDVDRVPGVSIARARSVVVACERPMRFHVDGEPRQGGVRLDVRLHPRMLTVAG